MTVKTGNKCIVQPVHFCLLIINNCLINLKLSLLIYSYSFVFDSNYYCPNIRIQRKKRGIKKKLRK